MPAGKDLESLVVAAADILNKADILRLHRWPVPMRVVHEEEPCRHCQRMTPQTKVAWAGRTGSDFFGVTRAGRAVIVEAKDVNRPRLPLGVTKGDGVKVHQLIELLQWHRAGALALIVWRRGIDIAVFDPDVFGATMDKPSLPWDRLPRSLIKSTHGAREHLFEPYLVAER